MIHERLGFWARQLRERLRSRVIRWVESRGPNDLIASIEGTLCPIVVLDITPQPTLILERLITIRAQSPNGLFLVLDSENRPELSRLARIAGATLALTGFTPPPYVASLIDQWLPLAEHRAATASPVILEETKRDEQNANYLIDLELQRFNAITRC